MTEFIRVRDKNTKHELDIDVQRVEAHPERYVVLDKKPVTESRPPVHHIPNSKTADE